MDLFAYRIIPVVVIDDADDALPLAEALIAGGLPIAEVTFRTDSAAEALAIMAEVDGMTVGAGTVIYPSQVELAVEAGAEFLVSPGLRADIVREAVLAGKPILPGAITPGEIMAAQALGVDTVKFFPAGMYGGPEVVRALSAPFTTMKFVPTGGVAPKNLLEYLRLPCVPAVAGSWMVPPDLINAHDFAAVTRLCREAVELASQI